MLRVVSPLLLSTGHVCQVRKSITQAVEKYNLILSLPTRVCVTEAWNMMNMAGFPSRMVSAAKSQSEYLWVVFLNRNSLSEVT